MSPHITEASAIAEIARSTVAPTFYPNRKGVVVTNDGRVVILDNENSEPHPKRKRAEVTVYDVPSFIAYVKSHAVAGQTHLFGDASETEAECSATFDYHSVAQGGEHGTANWGNHTATLNLRVTPEWLRWLSNNNRLFTQVDFAEFIEDNLADILKPDAAEILDIAQFLVGKKTVTFKSGRNLSNGAVQLEYSEQIDATSRKDDSMQVPSRIVLGLAPFVGAPVAQISARLRFRIGQNGLLSFQYVLDRPFKILEAGFNAAVAEIEKGTGLKVHRGHAAILPPS